MTERRKVPDWLKSKLGYVRRISGVGGVADYLANLVERVEELEFRVDGLTQDKQRMEQELEVQDAWARYLRHQVHANRGIVRYLVGDLNRLPVFGAGATQESFDYQWEALPEGDSMLSSDAFRAEQTDLIAQFTGRDKAWFAGKRVLDAGCGQGRWSYGFGKLGAQVVAIDRSQSGLARTREACAGLSVETHQVNLIGDGLGVDLEPFDLVWSFGVIHHTGNTYAAFQNLAPLVKPGGWLFLMVYLEPDSHSQCNYYNKVDDLSARLMHLPVGERVAALREELGPDVDLHAWFDAISPPIKERYGLPEITGWLLDAGFEDVRKTSGPENLSVVARKKGASDA